MAIKHAGILGRTQMGKSWLAHFLCRMFTEQGRETLVYDITLSDEAVRDCNERKTDAEWFCTFACNDEATFLQAFWGSYDVIAFIDEATESAGRYADEVKFTATRGSHQIGELGAGSSVFYVAHDYTSLNKTLRKQLSEFFIFGIERDSARDLANLFDDDELRKASKLPVGEFYHVGSGIEATKWKLDLKKMILERVS